MSRFVLPVTDRVTQGWGDNPGFYDQFGQKGHTGIDYGCNLGTEVRASGDGTVSFAGDGANNNAFTWIAGNCIAIDHGDVFTTYSHLSRLNVRNGQVIKQGQVIGWSGQSGYVSGPHLHFEFWAKPTNWGNGWSGRINPSNYLTKGESMALVEDTQPWLNRFKKAMTDSRGSERASRVTRAELRPWVGKDSQKMFEGVSDHPERDQNVRDADLGRRARRDKWDQQIYKLQDTVKLLQKQLKDAADDSKPTDQAAVEKAIKESEEATAAIKLLKK